MSEKLFGKVQVHALIASSLKPVKVLSAGKSNQLHTANSVFFILSKTLQVKLHLF